MWHALQPYIVHFMQTGGGLALIMGGGLLLAGFGTSYTEDQIPEKYR